MSDEIKLHAAMARQARAEALMRDELLVEAFTALETAYFEGWKNSPARDTDGRERLWQAFQIVRKVHDHLQAAITDGKIASAEVEQIAGRKKIFGVI